MNYKSFIGVVCASVVLIAIYCMTSIIEVIPLSIIGATVIFSLFKNILYKFPVLLWRHFKRDFFLYSLTFIGLTVSTPAIGAFLMIIGSGLMIIEIWSKDSYEIGNFRFKSNFMDPNQNNKSKSNSDPKLINEEEKFALKVILILIFSKIRQ